MRVQDLAVACDRCYAVRGLYGLSFFGENDLTLDEIVAAGGAPHRWVRCTRYGNLREAGYRLRRDGPNNHLLLTFPRRPSKRKLSVLRGLFDPALPNPHPL